MDLTIDYIDDDIDEPDEGFIVLAQVTTTDSMDEDNLRLIRSGIALMIITDDDSKCVQQLYSFMHHYFTVSFCKVLLPRPAGLVVIVIHHESANDH